MECQTHKHNLYFDYISILEQVSRHYWQDGVCDSELRPCDKRYGWLLDLTNAGDAVFENAYNPVTFSFVKAEELGRMLLILCDKYGSRRELELRTLTPWKYNRYASRSRSNCTLHFADCLDSMLPTSDAWIPPTWRKLIGTPVTTTIISLTSRSKYLHTNFIYILSLARRL